MGNSNGNVNFLPEPSEQYHFAHDPRRCQGECCRLDVFYLLDNEERIKMLDSTRNVLIDLREGIKLGKYKNSNHLKTIVTMRIMPRRYYGLLKQQQQMKQLQKQREEMTDEKIDEKFMCLIKRLDRLDQNHLILKLITERNK